MSSLVYSVYRFENVNTLLELQSRIIVQHEILGSNGWTSGKLHKYFNYIVINTNIQFVYHFCEIDVIAHDVFYYYYYFRCPITKQWEL